MAVKSVSEEPEVNLCDWRVLRDDREGNMHLMGYKIIKNHDGEAKLRVTSPLRYLHLHEDGSITYITSSGRRYKLIGEETKDTMLIARAAQAFWRDRNAMEYVSALCLQKANPEADEGTTTGVRP